MQNLAKSGFPASPTNKEGIFDSGSDKMAPEKLQTTHRRFRGSMMWICQTRLDLMDGVIQLSSMIPLALSNMESLNEFLILTRRLHQRVQAHHIPLLVAPLDGKEPRAPLYAQIIVFLKVRREV